MTDKLIRVKVLKGDGNLLRILWEFPEDEYSYLYYLKRNEIEQYSQDLRDQLSKIKIQLGKSIYASDEEKNSCINMEIYKLAKQGFSFYESFFIEDEEKRGNSTGADVINILNKFNSGYTILFFTDDNSLNIPWGLIYDQRPQTDGLKDSVDWRNYKNFWCFKYQLTLIYATILKKNIYPIPTKNFAMIPIINKNEQDKVINEITEVEKEMIDIFFEKNHKAITSETDFNNLTSKIEDNISVILLYLFGHGNSDKIEFGREFSMSANDLKNFAKSPSPSIPNIKDLNKKMILFMNGCKTAIDSQKLNFYQISIANPYIGYIGTEQDIPTKFAARFGLAFLYLFIIKGQRIGVIIDELRKKHFPLGLFYSFSCYPSFCTESKNILENEYQTKYEKIINENFSFDL